MAYRNGLFYKNEGFRRILYFFGIFFGFFIVYCLSPQVVTTYSTKMFKCKENYQKHCFVDRTQELWRATIPFVNELNQVLLVKTVFLESYDFEFKAEVELKHRTQHLDFRNVSQLIKCNQNLCNSVKLMHIPYILYNSYVVEIRSSTPIAGDIVEIQLQFVNAQYSVYAILVSVCLIAIELILLLLYLEIGENKQVTYVIFISLSLILFNIGVLLQFLLPFEGFWAFLASILKIQLFFTVLLQHFIRVHWKINTKYKYSHILIESIVLGVYCWLRFESNILLGGQENLLEIFKQDLNENKELFENYLILSWLLRLISVWALILSFRLIKSPGNSEEKNNFFFYLDLALLLFTLLSTHLGLLSPATPMNSMFFVFPFTFTCYIFIIQTQPTLTLPIFKTPNSLEPNPESAKLLELKLD